MTHAMTERTLAPCPWSLVDFVHHLAACEAWHTPYPAPGANDHGKRGDRANTLAIASSHGPYLLRISETRQASAIARTPETVRLLSAMGRLSARGATLLRLVKANYQGVSECRTWADGINLGLAETTLMQPMALSKLSESAAALDRKATYGYDAVRGGSGGPNDTVPFPDALAKYFSKALRVPVDPSHVVASAGATPVIENTVFGLTDPGEGLMVRQAPAAAIVACCCCEPASLDGFPRLSLQVQQPLYPGFLPDLGARAGISCQTVPRTPDAGCIGDISLAAVQAALDAATRRGVETRALLLTSPCNPTGRLHDPGTLREIVSFLADSDIDVICDEIYAGRWAANRSSRLPQPPLSPLSTVLNTAAADGCTSQRVRREPGALRQYLEHRGGAWCRRERARGHRALQGLSFRRAASRLPDLAGSNASLRRNRRRLPLLPR